MKLCIIGVLVLLSVCDKGLQIACKTGKITCKVISHDKGDENNIRKSLLRIQARFSKLFKKANIKNVTSHALRHTFASKLTIQGVSIYTVSRLLGHSN